MNIQVDPTSSNLASVMLNSKIRPRAVVGYGVNIIHPSPPNYVTRSPGSEYRAVFKWLSKNHYQPNKEKNSAINQSEFLAITCDLLKARGKSRAIVLGFASHWSKKWHETLKRIT